VRAIRQQCGKIMHISNNYLNAKQAKLAAKISSVAFPGKSFFCNSGAESVEAAIKFARKYGSASGRYEIITMQKSFHGRTLAAVTATGQEKPQQGFEPLPGGFKHVPFNDIEAVKAAIGPHTIGVMLELIQGEGGIHVATQAYVSQLRALCDERDMLLIFDEVQTGLGRTGKMFAFQHYGIEPDLMTLAKALGGGFPIGALVANQRIADKGLTPGTHASTYGGNPLGCEASLAVFHAIEEGNLLENTIEMGEYLRSKLEKFKSKYSFIREIRGKGLMLGMDLDVPGADIVAKAAALGLLINCTQDTVLRIVPAMTVTKRLINQAMKILDGILKEI